MEKFEEGGLGTENESTQDLILPGQDQNIDENDLVNTILQDKKEFEGGFSGADGQPNATELLSRQQTTYGAMQPNFRQLPNREWEEYDRLIDGPFTLNDRSIDDRRAEGQGFGEKAWNSYGVKLLPKIGTHVIGSTVGLVDGFGEVAADVYQNGFAASNWNKFFNNDFQRSLDDFNEALDSKYPVYATSQERNLGFMESVFGKGAANFWTEDFSQGLSFVAGAVLSEYATMGAASFMIGPKVANNLKRISALRSTAYTQKSTAAIKMLNKISRADRIYDGLTTTRRLMTGAFYEAGVEARHNYDSTVDKLNEMHLERTGEPATPEDQARIHDLAVKVSNGVFAGNVALVGYSNILLYRKVFGSGMKANKKFKNKIYKNDKGVYKAKHKDWGRGRTWLHKNIYGSGAWGRYAAYEGFVEEGGQKTLDIAGQYAAEEMYFNDKTPSQMGAVGELINHTFDGMAEAYTSTEGQKEIFLGVVLAALGLPSFVHKNEKGEKSFKIGYGKTGGILDYLGQYAEGKQEVEDLVKYMNENPDVMEAIKNNFDMLNGMETANDQRDYADATNNDFAYKNADHDAFFAYAFSRIKGGYYGDVLDSLEDMRDMDLDTFETMFGYDEETANMSTEERKEYLTSRRNKVIDSHLERAKKIKQIYDSLDATKLGPEAKKIYAQALSVTNDLDGRDEKLTNEVEEDTGAALTATVNKEEEDEQAHDNIISRVREFVMSKLGRKGKEVMETSEVGRQVKKEIGIKQFTKPGHPQIVLGRMIEKLASLKTQQDIHEANDNVDGYIEVTEQIESLEDEAAILAEAINQGTAPNISEEEQQILDEWKQRDPANYELKKDDVIKKLQDLRRIRAKRHQMLNLIQQLIDPNAANDLIQEFEEVAQDRLTEEEKKNLPDNLKRLARKYKGKIIEFDYTNKKGETNTHRVRFNNAGNNGLTRLPNNETFELLQRQKTLDSKPIKTQDDLAELELIAEELKKSKHIKSKATFDVSILEKAENIKELTEQDLLLGQLQTVTNVLQDGFAERLAVMSEGIEQSKQRVLEVAEQIKAIKQAIKEAKTNKQGSLYVNLNAIGRKGNFSITTARQVLEEVIIEERIYKAKIKEFQADLNILEDNALRIQVIHTALTDPESVSNLLDKRVNSQDVFQVINDLLGLTSVQDFYNKLGEQGFFDTNELTKLAGQKNKDGDYEIDKDILNDLLVLAKTNISKEYLNLMNTELTGLKADLKLLTQHRADVQRILNKMVDPKTGQVTLFPEQGLTQDDLRYVQYELNQTENDIMTIQGKIDMMEAETERRFREAADSNLIEERINAKNSEKNIADKIQEYLDWMVAAQMDPAEEADLENGETTDTSQGIQGVVEQTRYSPSFKEVGWTKTAGNHSVALKEWHEKYKLMVANGAKLTDAEKLHLEAVQSQLRFFRASPDVVDWTKKGGNKLQVVTRYNIRPEWKDKIVFFDIAKAQKSGRYDDLNNYQYADNLTKNEDRNEELEDIKLLLVDAKGDPVLVDGELVYTNMNSSSEFNSAGIFKGDKKHDLDAEGNMIDVVNNAQQSFIKERNIILSDNSERFFYIKGKGRGMPIAQGQEYGDVLSPVLGRLKHRKGNKQVLAVEEDLKDLRLEMKLPAQGVKGANQNMVLFNRFSVTSRFVYFGTEGKGYNGNLVPGIISRLSAARVNNIYNLSRYFAENQKEGAGISIGTKGFSTILKEQIMYGDRSKGRERQEFAIYMQEDAIYFGGKGSKITFEELQNPEKYIDIHEEYKGFLSQLFFNVNSTLLNKDKKARIEARKKGAKVKRFVTPVYDKFEEVIVNDDLSTDVIEWDNYTHFLLSDRNREIEDIPVRIDMPLGFNEAEGVNQAEVPQFMNIYLEHGNTSMTEEQLTEDLKNNSKVKPKVEETKKAAPEKTEENKYKTVTYVNKETGEEFEARILVDEAEIKAIKEAEVGEDAKPTDTLEGTPFDNVEDVEDPYFLADMADPTSNRELDLDEELKWFNANMPKDKNGNHIIGIDLVRGLIDKKAFGKFTKDGNILLSNLMTTPGILYHESWHAVTRLLISPKQRFALYDEVRGMRGSTQTYKGETKKMSELTDKEADEWLAEEFREYVLAEGGYNVGGNIKKSLLDKIFDYISNILNLIVDNKSEIGVLMSKINSGYFSDPNTNITIYDSKTEAYYEGTELTATMRNNAMEGMTVLAFHKALKSNAFELEDFMSDKKDAAVEAIQKMYGTKNSKGTVYSQMIAHITKQMGLSTDPKSIENLHKTRLAIHNNWDQLQKDHKKYLERFKIELFDDIEELEQVREQFSKPQSEIDPSTYLPKAVRVLLGTLPKTENGKFVVNSSGLPQLVDFGSIMNFLYREFANSDPADFIPLLTGNELQSKRPEIKILVNRLGLESKDLSDKTTDQMKLLIQTMMQFDQSNNTFYTQLMTRENGRMLIDSNQNRIIDKVKLQWTNQFKDRIQNNKNLGEEVDGELLLDKKAKVKVGSKEKSFNSWATDARRTFEETVEVLDKLGITFTDNSIFKAFYINEDTGVRDAVDYILQDLYSQPVSDLFKGNAQSNLNTLAKIEAENSLIQVDLQHRNPDGKTVHGVNLKTYADVLISQLKGSNRAVNIQNLLQHDNLRNSVWLRSMLEEGEDLEVVVLEGIEQQYGIGKSLSKGSPVDIGVMTINAVLGKGIIPLIRTADKKTEYGIKFGGNPPSLLLTEEIMVTRLQGYLKDELKAASEFNSKRKSKLHRIDNLKDVGGSLRFFNGVVPSIPRGFYNKKLTPTQLDEVVIRPEVVENLRDFLTTKIERTKNTLKTYNISPDGIDLNLLKAVQERTEGTEVKPQDILATQFTYEYMTGIIEQSKLLLGDLALYKDLFKRTSGISGTKAYPTSNPQILEWMNINMPNLLSNKEHSDTLRVSHRAAITTKAPYLNQYLSTLQSMNLPFEFIQNVNNVYSNMEEFDGGGFIGLDAYRSLLYRTGKWTYSQEAFYQKLANNEEISQEDIALLPPIKPQLFGPFTVDNQRLMTFHKFALFPLVPQLMSSSKTFADINQDMVDNDIDYMIFESVPKVGGVTAGMEFVDKINNPKGYDPFYEKAAKYNSYKRMSVDEKGDPLGLQELSFSDLGIQVETKQKITKEVREGSQKRSLLPVNVYDQGELSEGYEEFEELIDRYHTVNNTLINKDLKSLLKKLKLTKDPSGIYKLNSEDLQEFKDTLIEEFKRRDNPIHTVESITELLNSDTKFIDQLFEKNKIESLLYSLINNNIIRRTMPGGQFVLQASTGFENKLKAIKQEDFEQAEKDKLDLHDFQLKPLKFYRKEDPNDPMSKTLPMQVYLPSRFKDKMGLTIENVNDPNLDPDLLQLIAFRIPTEGLNSMDFIEIAGFLPASFGDTVIVPSEIVGKAGSDYDIDKLNIYFPNADKDLNRIKFDPDKSVKQQGKKALQNELQHIIRDVLSHPNSFDQLISPVGAYQLEKLAKEVAMLRNPELFTSTNIEIAEKVTIPLNETFDFENMINTSHRMFSGLGGIGIVATSSTQHAKTQRPGVNWNDVKFNFEGSGFGLSRVRDINNEDKISATIGQYITGYVDVTKKDFVFDINAGIEYAPIHMVLVRSGVPIDSVVYFMSQPIIDEYVNLKKLHQPLYSNFPLKSNDDIAKELTHKYGKEAGTAPLTADLLKSMIGRNSETLSPIENQVQVQVLEDFLRYKDLAEDLRLLKDATSVDTSNLNNGMAVRYAKQAINRLEQDAMFTNLDELLYGNDEGPSTVAGYIDLLNEVDGMFAEFKLGEYIKDAKQFVDNKLFELTNKELKTYKDDVIYKMKKFESFLASSIVQNTSWEYEKLSDNTTKLFKGKNSLPRKINNLKKIGRYKDNLLIQELTPILQVYNEDSKKGLVDGLRLFSKKLQPYDVDLLADAFMELKEINPELATDLIIFSALQSGYEFNPNSFFQVIPGTEVLSVLSKYFKQNKNEERTSNLIHSGSMSSLWEDFNQNYHSDSRIVPNLYKKIEPKAKVVENNSNEYISITFPSDKKMIKGREVNMYDTKLYKNTGTVNKAGFNIFAQINKKGIKNNLIEATGTTSLSIVNSNLNISVDALSPAETEVSNTILTVKRNTHGEVEEVLKEEDCSKK